MRSDLTSDHVCVPEPPERHYAQHRAPAKVDRLAIVMALAVAGVLASAVVGLLMVTGNL